MEFKAKMTEAKTSLEKKTRDINSMTKQWDYIITSSFLASIVSLYFSNPSISS
jgi:hypothetical protein